MNFNHTDSWFVVKRRASLARLSLGTEAAATVQMDRSCRELLTAEGVALIAVKIR
jgi:hypothetical protein